MKKGLIFCLVTITSFLLSSDDELLYLLTGVKSFIQEQSFYLPEDNFHSVTDQVFIKNYGNRIGVMGCSGSFQVQAIVQDDTIVFETPNSDIADFKVIECFSETPIKPFLQKIVLSLQETRNDQVTWNEDDFVFGWNFFYEGNNRIVGEKYKEFLEIVDIGVDQPHDNLNNDKEDEL